MLGKIIYNEQEQSGNYKWLGIPSYMTANLVLGTSVRRPLKIMLFIAFSFVCDQYTDKGSEILVTGRLHTYNYQKDDRKIYM